MGRPNSKNRWKRIVGAVEVGSTRRGTANAAAALAAHRQRERRAARSRRRSKLDPYADWLFGLVLAELDITLEEIRARQHVRGMVVANGRQVERETEDAPP